jgi:outer membrane protein assembly factor BamB
MSAQWRRWARAASALLVVAGSARADWPQSRGDAQNTASLELDVSSTGRPWTFAGSGRVYGYEPGMTVWSSPAVALVAGRALLAVGSYDHLVYGLDAATGEVRWKFVTGGPVYAAPTLSTHGDAVRVFAASTDRLVYALDAENGRQLWVHAVEDFRPTMGGARLSSPTVGTAAGADAVFVGRWVWDRSLGSALQQGGVTALAVADGKALWKAELGDNEVTAPVFARVSGAGRLYVGSSNGNLSALDADSGKELWRHTELDAIRASPAFFETPEGPRVVFASKFGVVRCLDAATGAAVWSFKTGDRVTGAPAVASLGGPLAVVIGSYDRTLYALDARTGAVLWRYAARGGVYSSAAIAGVGAEATVLVSAWDHALHAVSAGGAARFTLFTGQPLWDVSGLDESTWSSPIAAKIGAQWMVFVGGYDGTFRALPLEVAAPGNHVPRSHLWFWLSFPLSLGPVAGLAVWLTRRARRRGPADD